MTVNIANNFCQRIVHVTYQLFLKVDTMIFHEYAIKKLLLVLVWIFITNDDVHNENLDLHGLVSSILTISTMDTVSQN